MEVLMGYKTELKLDNQQRTVCKQHAGVARFAYNYGIIRKQEESQKRQAAADPASIKIPNAIDLHKEIVALKQTEEKKWLADVSKCVPQQALRDADTAYQRFFKKQAKYPKRKKKGKSPDSFYLEGHIHVGADWVQLPVLGKVALYEHDYIPKDSGEGATVLRDPATSTKNPNGKPKTAAERKQERAHWPIGTREYLSATVSRQADTWFVSILVREQVAEAPAATGAPIGIDLGIKTLAVASHGLTVENPHALRGRIKALRRSQRHLSRTHPKDGVTPKKKDRRHKTKKDRPYVRERPRSERCLKKWEKAAEMSAPPVEPPAHPGQPNQGKNREKARVKVARLHQRVANIRKNALHQATAQLVVKPKRPPKRPKAQVIAQTVVKPKPLSQRPKVKATAQMEAKPKLLFERPEAIIIEDLNVTGMMKNHTLARAIADVGMYEFKRQLAYKCEKYGIKLYQAHPFFPSTQLCSACHKMPSDHLDLSVRTYVCEHCGLVLDRDLNAARNLVWLYTASSAEIDACGEIVRPGVLVLRAVSKKQEENTEEDGA